jgi:hypothetical protein
MLFYGTSEKFLDIAKVLDGIVLMMGGKGVGSVPHDNMLI